MIIKEDYPPPPSQIPTFSPSSSAEMQSNTDPDPFAPPTYSETIANLDHGQGVAGENTPIPPEREHLYSRPSKEEKRVGGVGRRDVHDVEVERKGGMVISHDSRLNDSVVMEDWLRLQACTPPSFKLRCKGSHTETKSTSETHFKNKRPHTETRTTEESVIDFDFFIDLTSMLPSIENGRAEGVVLTTVSPLEPAYRGSNWVSIHLALGGDDVKSGRRIRRESGDTDPGKQMCRTEKKLWKKWHDLRKVKGWPVWKAMTEEFLSGQSKGKGRDRQQKRRTRMDKKPKKRGGGEGGFIALEETTDEVGANQQAPPTQSRSEDPFITDAERDVPTSSPSAPPSPIQSSLQDWIQTYISSSKPLKEFHLTKEIYGWDLEALMIAIKGLIVSTGYRGTVGVEFVLGDGREVIVKPDNVWSRLTSQSSFVTFLLCISLVYPCLMIYKRFWGGARYQICCASYAMKCYIPNEDPIATTSSSTSHPTDMKSSDLPSSTTSSPALLSTSAHDYRFQGHKEGIFMRRWEDAIKGGVKGSFRGDLGEGEERLGVEGRLNLDGYYD